MTSLPEVRRTPCFDCPWVRTAAPGWLGPYTAEKWVELAHSEVAIACHTTIEADETGYGDWEDGKILQCAGAAIYRSNIAKMPRNPEVATLPADRDLVFGFREFEAHHKENR